MVSNTSLVYLKVPTAEPVPGEHLATQSSSFDVDAADLQGGVLLKVKAISLDPYMREIPEPTQTCLVLTHDSTGGRMRDPSIQSYSPAFEIGAPVTAFAIGQVIRTESSAHPKGTVSSALLSLMWAPR